jgi:hypothetical protein
MAAFRRAMTGRGAAGIILAVWAVVALVGQTAHGDGMVFHTRDAASMGPLTEHEQRAAIVCRDGVEHLVIAVNIDPGEASEALWIFPVPGTPGAVTVDLADSFPAFEGTNPFEEAGEAVAVFGTLARATQVWTLFIEPLLAPAGAAATATPAVHTSVEKWGIRAEVVTAASAEALAQYVGDKGSTVDQAELAAFEPYMDGWHVLIVAWIASEQQLRAEFPHYRRPAGRPAGKWPCLYVEFPSERAFYPMRPTSAYGDVIVPLQLFVVGYVEPHWWRWWASGPPETGPEQFLQALPKGRFPYTRLDMQRPARHFTDDLWFDPVPEPDTTYARIVAALLHRWPAVLTYVVLIAGMSYAAGGLAGLLLFGEWRPYARVGVWNLLTLIAVDRVLRHAKDSHGLPLARRRGKEFLPGDFVFIFSITFVGLTIAFCQLLKLPLP